MKIRANEILPYVPVRYTEMLNAFIPSEAIISLTQDALGQTSCLVKENDVVTEGQIIATGRGLRSSVIHSPLPGIVSGFISCSMPDGRRTEAVKIKMKGEFSLFGKPKTETIWKSFPSSSLRRIIADAGIINTFGKFFPLAYQLEKHIEKKIPPVLIIRMFDEDPSNTVDRFIAEKYNTQITEGAAIIASALETEDIVFVYPSDFSGTIASLPEIKNVKTISMDTSVYPCGGSKQLLQAIVKKGFWGTDSFDDKLFLDSSTVYSVYEAVVHGVPAMEKIIQVGGDALVGDGLLKVRLGTTIRSLASEYGGFETDNPKIIINGLLKGTNISDYDTPITKYVKSIFFMKNKASMKPKSYECIKCGRCRSICPSNIKPDILYSSYHFNQNISQEYIKVAKDCTDCMLCNSTCPSRLPLYQTISILKEVE